MVRARKPAPSMKAAEVKAKIRTDTEQAAATRRAAETVAAQKNVPTPPTPRIVREVLTGMRADAPLLGKLIVVDPKAYKFSFQVAAQSGAGRVELRGASRPDVDWENDSLAVQGGHLKTLENSGYEPWLKFMRVIAYPLTRKEWSCAYEVEFQRDDGFDDGKHKRRYNPDIQAFEMLVTG